MVAIIKPATPHAKEVKRLPIFAKRPVSLCAGQILPILEQIKVYGQTPLVGAPVASISVIEDYSLGSMKGWVPIGVPNGALIALFVDVVDQPRKERAE